MGQRLEVLVGRSSQPGRKPVQQDHGGARIPGAALLEFKGIALAVADGISSSEVSHQASRSAVEAFLSDYFCTPDAWSVKTSVERVVAATNSWLHAQTRRSPYRYEQDRGYVCTFSALVLKSRTAHVFHIGDTRVYRLAGGSLEQITTDHRVPVAGGHDLLGRAMGVHPHVDIDYQALPVSQGDVFLLTTDGVHDHLDAACVASAIARHAPDLDTAAQAIVDEALRRGSQDNLTAMIVRVEALPDERPEEAGARAKDRPLPPALHPGMHFDGYLILRELHASHRSHVHLARDEATGALVAIKTPSTELREAPDIAERFALEEWVARRIDSPHVMKPHIRPRESACIYVATEYVEGCTLAQWMRDHPRPAVEAVRAIVEQVARGLRAMHRMEMLHQDLRPENVMVDAAGVAKIIDFGAVRVAGLAELLEREPGEPIPGTEQYTAPEYFTGAGGTVRSDQFSLGVIAYQMLTGRLPYGTQVARLRHPADLARLRYQSALGAGREIPGWIDAVLRKAVHPDPMKRYDDLAELVHDLRHPRREFLARARPALIERDPLAFWQGLSALLLLAVVLLLHALIGARR